jgi:hypothetical protein
MHIYIYIYIYICTKTHTLVHIHANTRAHIQQTHVHGDAVFYLLQEVTSKQVAIRINTCVSITNQKLLQGLPWGMETYVEVTLPCCDACFCMYNMLFIIQRATHLSCQAGRQAGRQAGSHGWFGYTSKPKCSILDDIA